VDIPDTELFLRTGGNAPEPDFEERVRVMRRHLELMAEVFGEEQGCRMFRKAGPWYVRPCGPSREFNGRVVKLSRVGEFEDIIDSYRRWRRQFLDGEGRLKAKYRPAPMGASFQGESDGAQRSARPGIAVPKGPVEVW
jgi:hypothetical protein